MEQLRDSQGPLDVGTNLGIAHLVVIDEVLVTPNSHLLGWKVGGNPDLRDPGRPIDRDIISSLITNTDPSRQSENSS